MSNNQDKIEKLILFRSLDKFAAHRWYERGLNPSDQRICEMLNTRFYYTATELIEALQKRKSKRKLKLILKGRLRTFNKLDYDTEEREFIASLFYEIALLLEINFKRTLNRWLYGIIIMTLMDVSQLFKKPDKKVLVHQQECTKCKMALSVIADPDLGIANEPDWKIAKCFQCNEYNLITNEHTYKRYSVNYNVIEYLSKEDFTHEQAIIRLEQIRFFRK